MQICPRPFAKCSNLIKIDHILNMQWRFVPHGTLGNERVNMSPEAKLPE